MNASFPTSPDQLSVEVLSAVLGREVAQFSRVPLGVGRGNMGEITRLDFDDGSPSLVAKFAASHAQSRRAAKRSGLFEREVRFYQRLAPSLDVRTPTCHAAHYDPETALFFLLLDYLPSTVELDTIAGIGPDDTALVLAELAKLHEQGRRFRGETWLQDMRFQGRIDNLLDLIHRGWRPLAAICPHAVDPERGPRVRQRFLTLMDRMARLDQTVVHGDIKPDNLQRVDDGVAILDWQAVGYGPPAWDVAYAMINCLTIEDRRTHEARLLSEYPHDLQGYEDALLLPLVVAAALTVLGDPNEPRRIELIRTTAERAAAALEDHGGV